MAELRSNTDEIDAEGSIDSFALETGPLPDRLPPMLFLAALVHGILIIGITFNAVVGDAFFEPISLEVTIVADPEQNVMEPDKAGKIARHVPALAPRASCLSTIPAMTVARASKSPHFLLNQPIRL